ncbi:MAG: 2-amino-4-hydroxy-6-hydroxymethyldihydropteridine diphosphokinase [Candidatus Rokubacteria bacterium]|nr:2-amino-4-hydroxy-6-hydroxymethyldihydropteridine diphosphokinase [Candidatus Rokubacteria bacterium]
MARVYLSVGSNLGDRLAALRTALDELRRLGGVDVVDASPLYLTEPWEQEPGHLADETHWFYNCVIAIDTSLEPLALLGELQGVETRLGRARGAGTPEDQRYAPRPLDIDILLWESRVISGHDQLHVPHLLMHERAFVLRPLADLAPEIEHPVLYQSVRDLLDALEDEHVVRRADLPARWFEM